MLFTTYKLHEDLLNKKYAIISPLILATTYLWFDYSHLATQDIIYSCLVTIGVLALVKIKSKNSFKEMLIPLIIGPYLFTSFILQSGLFTDRSRELRETMEYVSSIDLVKNQTIMIDKKGINNSLSQSKIISITLSTPKLGGGLENINQLKKSQLAWTIDLKK